MSHFEDFVAAVYAATTQAHDAEHYRCEQLGEGAGVPVTCSCDEHFGPTVAEWMAAEDERWATRELPEAVWSIGGDYRPVTPEDYCTHGKLVCDACTPPTRPNVEVKWGAEPCENLNHAAFLAARVLCTCSPSYR